MLQFMYTQAYSTGTEGEQPDAQCDRKAETKEAQPPTMVELLSSHIRINAIADYYDIAKLREASNTQIQRILDTSWSPHGFHIVIEKAMRTTRDKDLHHVLSVVAAAHVEELVNANENITGDDFTK